jgi:hypothetical protein
VKFPIFLIFKCGDFKYFYHFTIPKILKCSQLSNVQHIYSLIPELKNAKDLRLAARNFKNVQHLVIFLFLKFLPLQRLKLISYIVTGY